MNESVNGSLAWLLVATVLLVECGGAHPPSAPAPPLATSSLPRTTGSTYRFNVAGLSAAPGAPALDSTMVDDSGERRGLILSNQRVSLDNDGTAHPSAMIVRGQLSASTPVPLRLGGGFLFWTASTLYRARTFLGPLEPVAPLATNILAPIAFGRDFVLVRTAGDHARAYDLEKRKRVPLVPPSAIDTAATDDGSRVVALDSAGRAFVSLDGSKSWRDVTADVGAEITRLVAQGSEIWFEQRNHEPLFVEADGGLVRKALPIKPATRRIGGLVAERSKWLDLAVERGILLSEGRAAVAMGPAVTVVELDTGDSLTKPRVVAPGMDCHPFSASDGVLLACFEQKHEVAIVAHALDATPVVEKRFRGAPLISYALGTLVVGARCTGEERVDVACIRRQDGKWLEYDRSIELGARDGGKTSEVVLWAPTADGGAKAMVGTRDQQAGVFGDMALVDAVSGARRAFDKDIASLHVPNGPGVNEGVETSWVVTQDGTLRGYTFGGSVSVDAKGKVSENQLVQARLESAGLPGLRVPGAAGRALGIDDLGRLWQSIDYGASWTEVAPPPINNSYVSATCSEVGCRLGSWHRIGWPRDRPEPPTVQLAPKLVPSPRGPEPRLECVSKGLVTQKALPAPELIAAGDAPTEEWEQGFGARLIVHRRGARQFVNTEFRDFSFGSGYQTGLRALVHHELTGEVGERLGSTRPSNSPGSLDVFFAAPFDPVGRLRRASISIGEWFAASGIGPKTGESSKYPVRLPRDHGHSRLVLSNRLGEAAGLVLSDHDLTFWLPKTGAIRPIGFGFQPCGSEPTAGYLDASGKLFLACGRRGATRIVEARSGTVRWQLPPLFSSDDRFQDFEDFDAIAVAKDGRLSILRLPSREESPATDDPALLLSPDGPPIALAPWSTLELASSSQCARSDDGYRALIKAPSTWITIANRTNEHHVAGLTAIVRWSKDRVCLEALEIGYDYFETEEPRLEPMIVARFVGEGAGVGILALDSGTEYRQSLGCRLVPGR